MDRKCLLILGLMVVCSWCLTVAEMEAEMLEDSAFSDLRPGHEALLHRHARQAAEGTGTGFLFGGKDPFEMSDPQKNAVRTNYPFLAFLSGKDVPDPQKHLFRAKLPLMAAQAMQRSRALNALRNRYSQLPSANSPPVFFVIQEPSNSSSSSSSSSSQPTAANSVGAGQEAGTASSNPGPMFATNDLIRQSGSAGADPISGANLVSQSAGESPASSVRGGGDYYRPNLLNPTTSSSSSSSGMFGPTGLMSPRVSNFGTSRIVGPFYPPQQSLNPFSAANPFSAVNSFSVNPFSPASGPLGMAQYPMGFPSPFSVAPGILGMNPLFGAPGFGAPGFGFGPSPSGLLQAVMQAAS